MSRKHTDRSYYRRAMTRMDAIGLIAIFVVFLFVFPIVSYHRPSPFIAPCADNLKALGIAMYTYADENNQDWPAAAHAPAVELGKGVVKYAPGKIGSHRGSADDPLAGATTEHDTEMSVTRNLWTLIRLKMATPASFICPASDDKANDDNNPENYWDFRSWHEVSYGYQVPYGRVGQANSDRPCTMPLMADKGPFGASLEANKPNPGIPTARIDSQYYKWQPWNSPNHDSEGQNILHADGHAEWCAKPTYMIENIYTRWSDATGGSKTDGYAGCLQGTPPTSNETPFSDTDTLIYP